MRLFSLQQTPRLLVTILTALAQGALLIWLHTAVRESFWPATSMPWLLSLLAVVIAVPLTVQLLSEHWRLPALWIITGVMGALFFYFGWHAGSDVLSISGLNYAEEDRFIFGLVLGVMWLHFLPFLGTRLETGRWRTDYASLFAGAWQHALMLAEAALFTGLFWALLMLWAQLFKMLGYDFFHWMFTEPAFVYPLTTTALGVALYLTGSVERFVTVVREQLLGLLKWLAPIAALILVLFAPTLVFKLPDLLFHGKRAISAAWLLWLLALTVLLLNAGYQNGRIESPYPRVIGLFLRFVTPAMVIVAATALYALGLRVAEYGVTVDRVFAIIVALAAAVYSVGYTAAALRRGPWMRGIERVNVALAIGVIVVLGLTLTPIASPYRLAAASQVDRARLVADKARSDALRYLRFKSGAYGQRALERLAKLEGTDKATADLRHEAQEMLKRQNYWEDRPAVDPADMVRNARVYPAGRSLEPQLVEALTAKQTNGAFTFPVVGPDKKATVLFIDLNGDAVEECVVMAFPYFTLFVHGDKGWAREAQTMLNSGDGFEGLNAAFDAGDFSSEPAPWRDLRIGKHRLRFSDIPSNPGPHRR